MMLARTDAMKMATQIVSQALQVNIDLIDAETSIYDISSWDSLGQLSVILSLEQVLNLEITDPQVFASLTSIVGIADYLVSGSSRTTISSSTALGGGR